MADRFDVIVIGAGHNGLTTACLLARAGRRVLVLERRDVTGGMCAGEEFHPGFRSPGLLHDTFQMRTALAEVLNLNQHGLELVSPPDVVITEVGGPGITLSADPEVTAAALARRSPKDATRWRDYHAFVARARKVIEPLLNDSPPDLGRLGGLGAGSMGTLAKSGMAMLKLGKPEIAELLRVPPMCVADWLNEWFETESVKAGLAHEALLGLWAGPWSPGTAANLLLLECTRSRAIQGGAAGLALALERAARHEGVTLRTGAEVTSIRTAGGAATGVVVAGGETIEAPVVVSACDPRTTFLDLIGRGVLPLSFERRAEVIRARGTTAKVHLALNRRFELASRPGERVERLRTAGTLDDLERAFDAVKYRRASEHPLLDVSVPTVARPEWAAGGGDVVSILVHFAPHDLAGGWTADARERLGDAVMAELERVAPGVGAATVARDVLTPADIAARYGASGGHIHHSEHALDQLVIRPTLDTSRYATPLRGLFLCGSGSHPGGGVTCAPGALAAAALISRR